jgi:GH24 family phage-related lysozyme (muramidase)
MTLDIHFRNKLKNALLQHEGHRDFFYKDSVGQVTIGVGHLVRTEGEAASLRLAHRDNVKQLASPDEIQAAFKAVKDEPYKHEGKDHKMHAWGSGHYKSLAGASNIFMPPDEVERLLHSHIDKFHGYLRGAFTVAKSYKREFDKFPEPVRLALFDMIFNLGPTKFPSAWPNLVLALEAENWNVAAIQSKRPQLSSSRNQYVHDLFLAANRTP